MEAWRPTFLQTRELSFYLEIASECKEIRTFQLIEGDEMHDLIDRYTKWVTLPIMAVFAAAILFHQDGYVENNLGAANLGSYELSLVLVFTYLCLLFATLPKKSSQRAIFLILGALSALYSGLPWAPRLFEYNGDFYKFTNTDYWHILTLTLLTLTVSILLMILTWSKLPLAVESVKNLLKSSYSGSSKILSILMILPLLVLFCYLAYEIWQSFFESYISFGDYLYFQILLIAEYMAYFLVALCGFGFLQPVLVKWISVAHDWNTALSDFSLKTYLTRKISSALYGLTYVTISVAVGLGVPVFAYDYLLLRDLFTGIGFLGPIVFFPVGVLVAFVVWFILILIVRLTYEFANAIIHIAENTAK
jgi:hypothetical protein